MPQPNQNLVGVLELNLTSPKFDSLKPKVVGVSGENSALAWSSDALEDKGSITIRSKLLPLIKPDTFIHLGFGMGWLEEQTDGTPFKNIDVGTALGTKSFLYEDTIGNERRFVHTHNGYKCLRSVHNSGSSETGAGVINFDTGSDIPAGQHTVMYGKTLMNRRSEDIGKVFQFKQDRIGQSENIEEAGNSIYIKQDPKTHSAVVNCLEGVTPRPYFFGLNGPLVDNKITDFYWTWKINSPDVHNGYVYTLCAKDNKCVKTFPYHSGTPANATCVVKSSLADRPRWLKRQDYLGNNDQKVIDVELLVFNLFWQRGGHMFVLGDKSYLASCSRLIPLVPTSFNTDNSWTLNLWKEDIASFEECTVFLLDSALNVVAGVPLS